MKIQALNQINLYNFNGLKAGRRLTCAKNTQKPETLATPTPYDLEYLIKKEDEYFENFIKQPGKVTIEQYREIAKNHPRTLSKCYEICDKINCCTTPVQIAKFALSLKEKYDSEFDNYVIVSIGNSPAPVTELMSALGTNVIFAPISNLRWFLPETLKSPISTPRNVELFMKYCTKKGVKNYQNVILLDYVASGRTLERVHSIFKKIKGIQDDKLHLHSIVDSLKSVLEGNNKSNMTEWDINSFKEDLRACRLEYVSNVPHFPFDDKKRHHDCEINSKFKTKGEVFREFENYSTPHARAWALCSIHEAIRICEQQARY